MAIGNRRVKGGGEHRFYTVLETAEELSVSPNTVRVWCDKGIIKCYRLSRRGDRRIPKDEIDKFLEESFQSNPIDIIQTEGSNTDGLPVADPSRKIKADWATPKRNCGRPRRTVDNIGRKSTAPTGTRKTT
ncbi:MAG: helix-turn-helix domain-containing protein [Chloroflexota bacterium]|nr:helix-turn-helix domain-containing protein [Chloroflexota bacterium]